jgi:hypothetical protein
VNSVSTCSGEADNFRQVLLRRSDGTLLDGNAVAEVSHLLAEFIDNALAASSNLLLLLGEAGTSTENDHGVERDEPLP